MKKIYTIALFLTFTSCISYSADEGGQWTLVTRKKKKKTQRSTRPHERRRTPNDYREAQRPRQERAVVIATVINGGGRVEAVYGQSQQTNRPQRAAQEATPPVIIPTAPKKPCKPRKPSEYLGLGNRALKSKERYEKEMEKYEQDYAQYEENLAEYERKVAEYKAARPAYESEYPALTSSTTS